MRKAELRRAMAILGPGVVTAAETIASGVAPAGIWPDGIASLAVVDGGTDAGVMAAMGRARAHRASAVPVLLGVAPREKVTWQDEPADGKAGLEPNHSHFILAEADDWGGETGLLIEVAARLARSRVVMVVAGGGKVTQSEVLAAVRHGWKVFVVAGTGGLARKITRARRRRVRKRERRKLGVRNRLRSLWPPNRLAPGADKGRDLEEIVRDGDIEVFTGDDPRQLGYRLAWELREEPVLKDAWRAYATYDRIARRERATFQRFQASILLLGLAATLLALIQYETGGPQGRGILHWLVVIVPILVSALIAWSARRWDGGRWVTLRAAAEEAKAEIYRYRTGTEAYRGGAQVAGGKGGSQFTRLQMRMLQEHLSHIDDQLVRTQACMGPLTPYAGPFPPRAAGTADDGLSPLDAQGYLRIRVQDQIGYFHRRIRHLDRLRTALELAAIAAGGAGAIVAALGADVWVGLTSGSAGAALAYLGYLQVENNIVAYNRAASKLAHLGRWWHTLGPEQPAAKTLGDLVTKAEAVLGNERAGWVHHMSDALEDLKNRQAAATRKIRSGSEMPLPPSADDRTGR